MNLIRWVSKNKIEILILLSIYFLALGARIGPADRFPNIMGFDSYWAARHTKHMIEGGWFPYNETMIDYPFGRTATATELGWWGLNAVSYKAVAAVNGVSGFDYSLFGKIASWNTAIFGALAIPALYLFLRKSFNRIAGLAGALFLTGAITHLQYSIYGHAENDALGFSLLFLALYTFVLAVKEKKIRYLVLNALVFSWLAITWQSYIVATVGIAGTVAVWFTFIAAMKMMEYTEGKVDKSNYILAMASILPSLLVDLAFSNGHYVAITLLPLAGSIIYCAALQVFYFNGRDLSYLAKNYKNPVILSGLSAILLLGALVPVYSSSLYTAPLGYVGVHAGGAQEKPDYVQRLDTTIAEQARVSGGFMNRMNYLSQKYFGVFLWLGFFGGIWALMKSLIMPFVNKRFDYELDLLVAVLVLVILFTQTSKEQTTFFLSAPVMLGAGYLIGELWKQGKRFLAYAKVKRGKEIAGIAVMGLVLVLAMPNVLVLEETSKNYQYDVPTSWWETFDFINKSIPEGSVFAFWWDYGHWIAYFNGDKVNMLTDNVHSTPGSIYVTAASFTHTTTCKATGQHILCDASSTGLEKAELESLSILKPYGTTHILIDKEMIDRKVGAPQIIANNIVMSQNLRPFDVPCTKMKNTSIITCWMPDNTGHYYKDAGEGRVVPTNPIMITEEQFDNAVWPGIPYNMSGIPVSLLPEKDHSKYAYQGIDDPSEEYSYTLFVIPSETPLLYSFMYRLYFKDPNLKHVKLVYDNGWNKIYEINWEGVPDPDKFPRDNPNIPAWTEQFYEVFKKGGR